jgi:hypothetical protein
MHIYTHTPLSACTQHTPLTLSTYAYAQRITSRHTPNAGTSRITSASREAVFLIRSTLPMSRKLIRFELFSDRPRINTLKGKKRV